MASPFRRETRAFEPMKNIIGRKVGMTSVFTPDGRYVPVTVIEAGPCVVLQRKTIEKDGYEAVALAFGDAKRNALTQAARRPLQEGRARAEAPHPRVPRGDRGRRGSARRSRSTDFAEGDRVDVRGISKGHGFSGGIKRWNFSGGGASHGSMIHRQPAINGDTNAGRTVIGSHRPGHYGVDRTTHAESRDRAGRHRAQSAARPRRRCPGARNGIVMVTASGQAAQARATAAGAK